MSTCTEGEWTCVMSNPRSQTDMDSAACDVPTKADVIKDPTPDDTSDEDKGKNNLDCTCKAKPKSCPGQTEGSDDEEYYRPRRADRRPRAPRSYYPSPGPYYPPPPPPLPFPSRLPISTSAQLLDLVGGDDQVVELAHSAPQRFAYLVTYPFGERDVKKWSWLFSAGIEDEFITSIARDSPRSRSPRYERYPEDAVLSVNLSRALDVNVVPENTKHNVRYFIITQNSLRSAGHKLIVAESRKAAGMLIYLQMLRADSVLFVGAMVHECQTKPPKKFEKVNSVDEAVNCYKKGFVGVIC
ncbi:hypothetical protein E8E13_007838 [Curvularia kusanoi]|uniref:Uncharacterized protein n=1 Tax=Curvularia kusanoi TaxID=90978 RepID=A0A9P4W8A1_CURKU|nr:hypothetical protein E8E13_007838 [Curvularia kusanoi]